ncbi:MAG: 5-methylcytosine-specific restriction endonuclease system specificity protein McrC [Bacteroidales bacterium]|nr:5-methylcytosine-specific restriction endonuclease system specificity protein McrC [Bacteroidales bacterium]MCF8343450.1 5-methylcytosine-specific restriction endonuclease system specificity protein McrC [Bacteroidales bacterium]MCF8351341.1 5-methylcytosine-specific restriction endonuclease system specificity protein McrC [Bacteroidales bacterium]MCF8375656.1 5-methylcytosine-specific restriction endonuclease system specificity protein McrC [Bacteroidales bacterium]MCF8400761.1 5-methylcyto
MEIPIRNIYYLLCYAWDKLEEGSKVDVGSSDYKSAVDLFARVLANGSRQLFKRGLERDYNLVSQEYTGIKGKIGFGTTIKKNLLPQAKTHCDFDEFEHNVLTNQILKATLFKLTKTKGLDDRIKAEVWECYQSLPMVDDIDIHLEDFSKIRIHRNNSFYEFLLKICRILFESIVIDEIEGEYKFKEFTGNTQAMSSLFEDFIRNFYKREQKIFPVVRREDIRWNATAIGDSDEDYLPKMQTDITLESPSRKVVIDAKYYQETLSYHYKTLKFHSNNLYQLFSYVKNLEKDPSNEMNKKCEGILLYPTINKEYDESYEISGHIIRVATINLADKWTLIKARLLKLLY